MRKRFLIYAVVLFLIMVPVVSALAFEIISSQGNGLGQTAVLSFPNPSTLVNIPSGGLRDGRWCIEAGFNRQFDLSELDQVFLVGAYRYGKVTTALGFSQFGKRDYYKEITAKLTAAYHFDSLCLSLGVSGLGVYFGEGYGRFSTQTLGLGVSYRLNKYFIAFTADNLNSPKFYDNAVSFKPLYSTYAEVIGLGRHSLTAKMTFEKYQKPIFGFGQKLYLSDRGAFFWGIATEPVQYGGGVEFIFSDWLISYATSYHTVLDFSHTITFSYGLIRPKSKDKDGFK
ncbi:MAG: hypothetical protein ACOYVF_06465 [Candidatus Zixiibacteriota bacterium]